MNLGKFVKILLHTVKSPPHEPTFWAKFSDPRVGSLRGDLNPPPYGDFLGCALRAESVLWEGTKRRSGEGLYCRGF